MERYIIILCLSILSVGASVQQVRVQSANKDTTISLPHTGSQFDTEESNLAVDCGQGTVKLTLSTSSTEILSGIINIAEGFINSAEGCSSERKAYGSENIVAQTTKDRPCGRKDVDGYYIWNVGITEYSTQTEYEFERFVQTNAVVQCAKAYNAPSTVTEIPPTAISLTTHISPNAISFTFTKNGASNHLWWIFDLVPQGTFAKDYSYEIGDLVIHPVGATNPSRKLIEASCVEDKAGTTVTNNDDHSTTLKVRPFQFASVPDAKITLTVTVIVCEITSQNEMAIQNGEKRCKAVRPEDKCPTTRLISEEARRMRSRRQVFESFQKKSVVFTATVAV